MDYKKQSLPACIAINMISARPFILTRFVLTEIDVNVTIPEEN